MTDSGKSHRYTAAWLFLLATLVVFPTAVRSADAPFTGASNWGGTGLMAVPTARVLKEGTYRLGAAQVHPYRYYYGAVSPLPGVEIDGRVTEIIGVQAFAGQGSDYGNFKDKAVDLKLQLIREMKYFPAVAVGFMDPHGTRLYSSQYLVVSKQVYPFDFTLGFANGRFGKRELTDVGTGDSFKAEILTSPRQWWEDANWFAGVQFSPVDWLSLMVEYDPTPYHTFQNDPARGYFPEPVRSKFNFGLRLKPWDWMELALSYQRGDTVGANLSLTFELGQPLIPIVDAAYRETTQMRASPLEERITEALYSSGFSDIAVLAQGGDLRIQAANRRYFYDMKALGVILRIVDRTAPPEIRDVRVTLTRLGIPMTTFSTNRGDIQLYASKALSLREFLSVSELRADAREPTPAVIRHREYFDYGLKPDFKTYLNDPSGFFKYRFGLSGWASVSPWPGGMLLAASETFPANNISSPLTPSSNAVRSDLVDYIQEKFILSSLLVSQTWKADHEIYTRLSAGILEIQYTGVDAEVAKPLFGGRILVGLSGSAVKKRDPKSPFRFKENDYKDYYTTGFFNARLSIPELDANIDMKAGRFLAGDNGVRVTVSKSFGGVVLSAWYSVSDTSIFKDSFNQGYHDKGIAVSIPIWLFLGRDSRTSYSYALSPWTRDVAQDIAHPGDLFDFIGRSVKVYLEKDWGMVQ
jgi:hypothetical protein